MRVNLSGGLKRQKDIQSKGTGKRELRGEFLVTDRVLRDKPQIGGINSHLGVQ